MIIKVSVIIIDGVCWKQNVGCWFGLAGMYYDVL